MNNYTYEYLRKYFPTAQRLRAFRKKHAYLNMDFWEDEPFPSRKFWIPYGKGCVVTIKQITTMIKLLEKENK